MQAMHQIMLQNKQSVHGPCSRTNITAMFQKKKNIPAQYSDTEYSIVTFHSLRLSVGTFKQYYTVISQTKISV